MSAHDIRARWEALHDRLDAAAVAENLSEAATYDLSRAYGALTPDERRVVDGVIAEWAKSDDEKKRFDALALIREHRIASALPAVDELAARLSTSKEPDAPYELAKIRRLKAHLGVAE